MIFGLYHCAGESVGLISTILKELSMPFRDIHLYAGDGLPRNTSDLAGLIIMGGPMCANAVSEYPFLFEELRLIEKIIADEKPILGICLGSQLIAKALGSRIYPNHTKELGWHPIQLTPHAAADPVFRSAPKEFDVLHWHGDTFELPKDAVQLASSNRCENQAFRWGPVTYGLQFHLEATPGMVQQWSMTPEGEAAIASAGEDRQQLLDQTPSAYAKLEPVARDIFSTYFKVAFGRLTVR